MSAEQRSMFDNPLLVARELKARRKYDEAMAVLTRALEEHPDDAKLRGSLADLYYRIGHPRRAMALAGAILAADPNDPRALVVMGNTLLAKKKTDEALEYFRLATEVAPTDYLWGRIARCLLSARRPREALDALLHAEDYANPLPPRLQGLRAACYRQLGEEEAERQAIKRALRSAPPDPQGFFTALWPILDDLSPREAAALAARLREVPGQEGNPHLILFEAEALVRSRQREEAAQLLSALLDQGAEAGVRQAAEEILHKMGAGRHGEEEAE